MGYKLWSGNGPSSFLTEAATTTMKEDPSSKPLSTPPSKQLETISLEQVDLISLSN